MSHESYLTVKDKLESAVGASDDGVTLARAVSVPWVLLAGGLGIGAALAGSGALAIGLGAAAAYSAYRTVKPLVRDAFSSTKPRAASEHDEAHRREIPAPALEAVPQLINDDRAQWREQVGERTSRFALRRTEQRGL